MKKLFFILMFIALTLSIQKSYCIDTAAASYMPLQVGNVWVYGSYSFPFGGNYIFSLKITGTSVYNGHLYFNFLKSPGNQVTYVRYDSVSNILRSYGGACSWLVQERNMDSLWARLNDSAYYNCDLRYRCTDTSNVTIFNQSRKRKTFYQSTINTYNSRTYAKNIGLIFDYYDNKLQTTYVNINGYVINGAVYGDTAMVTGINQTGTEIPDKFSLSQNYPNPFNPSTNIKFQIPKSGFVKLIIFDVLGKEVQIIVNQQLSPGSYEADFDGRSLPSGVYYYKLEAGDFTETKKMVLIK